MKPTFLIHAAALAALLCGCYGEDPALPPEPDPAAWAALAGDAGGAIADGSLVDADLSDGGPTDRCSGGGSGPSEMIVINNTRGPIERFWVDFECNEVSYGIIAAGQTVPQPSFVEHIWRFRGPGGVFLRDVELTESPRQEVVFP